MSPYEDHPAIEMLQLPDDASDADWHDAVTALVEADAYWALFPEQVVPDAAVRQWHHER